MEADPPKRKPGRPPGVRNKPQLERQVPPSHEDRGDYRHVDPAALVSRQLAMIDWAQQAMRNEMRRAMQAKGTHIQLEDINKLEKLSNSLVRGIEALKRSSDLASELSLRMSPEELLEAALQKIEGQDLATLNNAIKRLRLYRAQLAPMHVSEKAIVNGPRRATDAIADLDDE